MSEKSFSCHIKHLEMHQNQWKGEQIHLGRVHRIFMYFDQQWDKSVLNGSIGRGNISIYIGFYVYLLVSIVVYWFCKCRYSTNHCHDRKFFLHASLPHSILYTFIHRCSNTLTDRPAAPSKQTASHGCVSFSTILNRSSRKPFTSICCIFFYFDVTFPFFFLFYTFSSTWNFHENYVAYSICMINITDECVYVLVSI